MNWFTVERIDEDTYAISEFDHPEETHCWLLIGEERCLLIDTGLGVGNLSEVTAGLTSKPIIAAVTHIHWDHIGGMRYFPEFCANENELEWLNSFPLPVSAVRKMLSEGKLPDDFDLDGYSIFQGAPARLLCDGDKIELGGRTVTALHTPGHSPGHMCFWEAERGCLYTGDLVYKGTLYANYPSTDPEAYLRSLKRIAELPVKRIFPGHHSLDVQPALINEMVVEFDRLKREGRLRHGSGLHDFNEWSILL